MARKTRNQRKKAASSSPSTQSSSSSLFQSALTTYRPIIDSALFVLAIIGVLVTVHLWIQQEIVQFSQGCWGFNPPAGGASAQSDCALVAQSDAGKLFGISNVYWGIGYYILLSIAGFMIVRATADRLPMLKRLRAGFIAFGFFFSMYLVNVQMGFVEEGLIQETCKLCMTSAGIAATMFVVMLIDMFTKNQAEASSDSLQPARLYTILPVIAALLLVGDYAWFTNKASDTPEVAAATTTVQPASANTAASAVPAGEAAMECVLDERYAPYPNYKELLNSMDPTVGPADSRVTVIEYFDPNCPHCQALHPIMKNLIEEYKDRVHFVYKPFALGGHSVPQIEAMYVAKEQGKFEEMLDHQMAKMETRGLPLDQIRGIATDIGMDVSTLNSRLRAQLYRQIVMDTRQDAAKTGLNSVPAVLVNGQFIGTRSQECIAKYIEEAL
ncbi:MAG: thioredoxin domain-containing protein [Rhodothermaceae bacterium]|nr:thioredoxin domain-containing protein [Rhodothermaceae bacterium]